jgi:hypothetical protein
LAEIKTESNTDSSLRYDNRFDIMPQNGSTPASIAAQIRSVLKHEGSVAHAEGVQWFFKEEIKSRGWYTADLRRVAIRFRWTIVA